jgi:hypothetical protein
MGTKGQPRKKRQGAASIVQQIGEALGETRPGPLTLIRRIVKTLGTDTTLDYLRRTQQIEESGGMQTSDGTKRRTPGGVFFHLIKSERPIEETYPIFQLKPYIPRPRAERPTKKPPAVPLAWEERGPLLIQKERAAVSVTIQLRGQPEGSITDTGSCILLTMQNTKRPHIPKGVPTPPEEPIKYDVYVSYKLWKKVAEAAADSEDTLIIDGYPHLDKEQESIAVIATGTSSRKLKMLEAAGKRQPGETREER